MSFFEVDDWLERCTLPTVAKYATEIQNLNVTAETFRPDRDKHELIELFFEGGIPKLVAADIIANARRFFKKEYELHNKPLGVFWDVENVRIPKKQTGAFTAYAIKEKLAAFGHLKLFNAYFAVEQATMSEENRSGLQLSGCHIIDTPHMRQKEVADKMIIVDALLFAMEHKDVGGTIVLITGDTDFAYLLARLSELPMFRTVVVCHNVTHALRTGMLRNTASAVLSWETDIMSMQPKSFTSAVPSLCSSFTGAPEPGSPIQNDPAVQGYVKGGNGGGNGTPPVSPANSTSSRSKSPGGRPRSPGKGKAGKASDQGKKPEVAKDDAASATAKKPTSPPEVSSNGNTTAEKNVTEFFTQPKVKPPTGGTDSPSMGPKVPDAKPGQEATPKFLDTKPNSETARKSPMRRGNRPHVALPPAEDDEPHHKLPLPRHSSMMTPLSSATTQRPSMNSVDRDLDDATAGGMESPVVFGSFSFDDKSHAELEDDLNALKLIMKQFGNTGDFNPLKTKVATGLRDRFPLRFREKKVRAAVLNEAVDRGICKVSGTGSGIRFILVPDRARTPKPPHIEEE